MSTPLLQSLHEGVLTLTLNRPEKRNALSGELVAALASALAEAELDGAVRVVCIRGAGKDFCAGADLRELLDSADRSPAENEAEALRLGAIFLALRALPKPVVAVVEGRALAGGAGLATACDLVVMAESASLGYPEIQRGFVPAMVMAMLVRQVGERQALHLTVTGRTLVAEEARALGFVSKILPAAELQARAAEMVAGLAKVSLTAYALTKQLVYAQDGLPFADAIKLGARINAMSRATPDFRAAIAQFLKK